VPERPPSQAAAPEAPAVSAAPEAGQAKMFLIGICTLLALAAASYGVYLFWSDVFMSRPTTPMSCHNTPRRARVGHIAAILPGDNTLSATAM